MKGKNKEFEVINSVQICQMTVGMVEVVSRVHMQGFKGAMNTRLGTSYVRKFLDWFVRLEGGITLVAILKTGGSEEIVGYVVGAPLGYGKAMNRELFWVASWNAFIRPWLFLNNQFRGTIKARLAALLQPSHERASKVDLPLPAMSLVGIAVIPNKQGQNIGKELLCAFEKRARDLHVRSLCLSVYLENSAARHTYEKCGWVTCENSLSPGKAMAYYKKL